MNSRKLPNLYNNCYLNSIVQCLFHLHLFRKCILSSEIPEDTLTYHFQNLLKNMNSPHINRIFLHFLNYFWKLGEYHKGEQSDAFNVLLYFLQKLHEEIPIKFHPVKISHSPLHNIAAKSMIEKFNNNFSPIYYFFHFFEYHAPFQFIKNDHLIVDLPTAVLEDLNLSHFYTKPQHLTDARGNYVSISNHRISYKLPDLITNKNIWNPPIILLIKINRRLPYCYVHPTGEKWETIYFSNEIIIPEFLDLTDNIHPASRTTGKSYLYRLNSLVARYGISADSGRYTAFCVEDSKIIEYNDIHSICYDYLPSFDKYRGEYNFLFYLSSDYNQS